MKFVKEKLLKEVYVEVYKKAKPLKYKGRFVLTLAVRLRLLNFKGLKLILKDLILKSELPLPVVDDRGNIIRNEEVFVLCHCLGIVPEVIYL